MATADPITASGSDVALAKPARAVQPLSTSIQPVGSEHRPLHSAATNVVWTGGSALSLDDFRRECLPHTSLQKVPQRSSAGAPMAAPSPAAAMMLGQRPHTSPALKRATAPLASRLIVRTPSQATRPVEGVRPGDTPSRRAAVAALNTVAAGSSSTPAAEPRSSKSAGRGKALRRSASSSSALRDGRPATSPASTIRKPILDPTSSRHWTTSRHAAVVPIDSNAALLDRSLMRGPMVPRVPTSPAKVSPRMKAVEMLAANLEPV